MVKPSRSKRKGRARSVRKPAPLPGPTEWRARPKPAPRRLSARYPEDDGLRGLLGLLALAGIALSRRRPRSSQAVVDAHGEEVLSPTVPALPTQQPCPCGSGLRFLICHGKD